MKDPRAFSSTRIRRCFLRLLALVHLLAFASAWIQIHGLVGDRGILPARDHLATTDAFVPSLVALAPGDLALHLVCGAGVAAALLLACGRAPRLALASLWILYLSIVSVGRAFMAFQWDGLLLETTFLAFFLAAGDEPPATARWLLAWLLFRLILFSGLAKVAGADPAWRGLTALAYHFETQPLPLATAWFAHHLPRPLLGLGTLATLAIELGAPWSFLGGPRLRRAGAAATALLQILIGATGNFGVFNLTTLALVVLLLDDAPSVFRTRFERRYLPLAVVFVAFPLAGVPSEVAAFRTVNDYGPFGRMTTERWEVVVEGTSDGVEWKPYAFRYKPDDVAARPRFLFGHMPRLDWRLWFVPLEAEGLVRREAWLDSFLDRLLEGSEPVLGLLASNPFPDEPPSRVRAVLHRYRFSAPGDSGWWTRERGRVLAERGRIDPRAGRDP